MSTFDTALEGVRKFTDDVDEALLKVLAKNYAITQAKKDTATVACSDKSEVKTVIANFGVKKLGVDAEAAAAAVKAVCEDMSSSRQKNRIVFYYLMVKKLGKEAVFS